VRPPGRGDRDSHRQPLHGPRGANRLDRPPRTGPRDRTPRPALLALSLLRQRVDDPRGRGVGGLVTHRPGSGRPAIRTGIHFAMYACFPVQAAQRDTLQGDPDRPRGRPSGLLRSRRSHSVRSGRTANARPNSPRQRTAGPAADQGRLRLTIARACNSSRMCIGSLRQLRGRLGSGGNVARRALSPLAR